MIIGLISDTHGLLREEVLENLKNCNFIIHAGDIGEFNIIDKLNKIAKTEFVKGNIDKNIDPYENIININGKKIYLIHDISKIKKDLVEENIEIVVYGHSHKSNIYVKEGILYINPGAVGPRRFKLPITMAKLYIEENNEEYIKKQNEDLVENPIKNTFSFRNYKVEFITI